MPRAAPKSSAANTSSQPAALTPAPNVFAGDLEQHAAPWSTEPKAVRHDRFAIGQGRLGQIPLATVSVLAGPGGVFKTSTAILQCLHVASGKAFAGLEVRQGSALVVSLEEDAEDMGRRLGATAVTQFGSEVLPALVRNVGLIAMPGIDGRFIEQIPMVRAVYASKMVGRLIEQARLHAERTGLPVRMIVVDHARLAVCGDINDSAIATELIRALTRVASETGAAVVLIAHSPKSSLNPNREDEFSAADVLGSGAFVDNARFASVVFPLTASERKRFGLDPEAARQYVGLRVIKSNFSESGRVIYLRKVPVDGWGVAVPEPVELKTPTKTARQDDDLEHRIVDYVAARPGQFTVDRLAKHCAGNDGPMAAGRPAIKAATDRLVQSGRLQLREPTHAERTELDLPPRTRIVMFAVPEVPHAR
jgi:hypothetical protein